MGKIITFLVFIAALAYVVFPEPSGTIQDEKTIKEIEFWGIYDLPEVYKPVIEEFKKTNPEIEITYKQFSNAEEYHQVLIRQLEKGRGPDIFLFHDGNRINYGSFINPTSVEDAKGFPESVKEKLATNRLLFGIPLWVDSLVLYYNKRYYPEGIQPRWYDFAEQTKEIGIPGVAMGSLTTIRSGWEVLKALFLQKNVKVSGKPENNLFDVLEFFHRFAYPIDRYFNWSEVLSRNYPDLEIDSFVREKVAAIAGYSSLYRFMQTKSDQLTAAQSRSIRKENIGVASFPQFSPENPKYLAKYYFLTVSLYSKHPNESWEFIRFLTNETNSAYYQNMTGRNSARMLPENALDTELQRVQQHQLPFTSSFSISPPAQEKIQNVVERAIKDKRVLREILEETL